MPSDLLARAIDLGGDDEYLVFFADDAADLPDDDVEAELEVVATVNGAGPTRGAGLDLLRDLGIGLAGNAGWTGLLATLTATVAYLRRRRQQAQTKLDSVEVARRVHAACVEILGRTPTRPDDVDIHRNTDGTWTVVIGLGDGDLEAQLDATGTMMLFRGTRRQ